jgi:hypothetical protein
MVAINNLCIWGNVVGGHPYARPLKFGLRITSRLVTTSNGQRAEPCNPGGGSPSMRVVLARITGPLLTVRV